MTPEIPPMPETLNRAVAGLVEAWSIAGWRRNVASAARLPLSEALKARRSREREALEAAAYLVAEWSVAFAGSSACDTIWRCLRKRGSGAVAPIVPRMDVAPHDGGSGRRLRVESALSFDLSPDGDDGGFIHGLWIERVDVAGCWKLRSAGNLAHEVHPDVLLAAGEAVRTGALWTTIERFVRTEQDRLRNG